MSGAGNSGSPGARGLPAARPCLSHARDVLAGVGVGVGDTQSNGWGRQVRDPAQATLLGPVSAQL